MSTTFVYNTVEDNAVEEELELVFGVFIDGTLNNKDNTDMRNKYARDPKSNIQNEYIFINYDRYNKIYNK